MMFFLLMLISALSINPVYCSDSVEIDATPPPTIKRARSESFTPLTPVIEELSSSQLNTPQTEPILPYINPETILPKIPEKYKNTPWIYSDLNTSFFTKESKVGKDNWLQVGNYFSCLQKKPFHVLSSHFLLVAFLLGCDTALPCLHRLAQKYPGAYNILGLIYGYGIRVIRDVDQSVRFFTSAHDDGYYEGAIHILSLYNNNLLFDNYSRLVQAACNNVMTIANNEHFSSGLASYQLYLYFLKQRDDRLSLKFLVAAAESNYPEALILFAQNDSSTLTVEEKFKIAQDAEKCGNIDAHFTLSEMYKFGVGTEKNPAKAEYHLSQFEERARWREYRHYMPYLAAFSLYIPLTFENITLHPWVLSNIGVCDEAIFMEAIERPRTHPYTATFAYPKFELAYLESMVEESLSTTSNIMTPDLGIKLLDPHISVPNLGNTSTIESNFLTQLKIESLTLPSILPEMKRIEDGFMESCTHLKVFSFPSSPILKSIGNNFLYGCSELNVFSFPNILEQLATIGNNFLRDCTNITHLSLPETKTLKSFGHSFSAGTRALKEIELGDRHDELESIGRYFLANSGIAKLKLPEMPKLKKIEDNFLFESAIEELDLQLLSCDSTGAPGFIGRKLCVGCSNLRKVTIPHSGNVQAWRNIFHNIINTQITFTRTEKAPRG